MPQPRPTTRLAPSPTGALHLGNARTFLINWALARQQGWRIILRIEDLDGPRVKPGADQQALEDLRFLGLDWDEGPLYQRGQLAPYQQALAQLRKRNLIYPCTCSRKELLQAQSAPHAEDHELRYPGTCRPTSGAALADVVVSAEDAADPPAWRLRVPDETMVFTDEIHGLQQGQVQREVGDFVVATKAGLPAYQLAVVIDDSRQGVSAVIRGDDLIGSTGRQLWLYRLLNLTPLPRYWHLPLVVGPDGRRLAKRHGDSRIACYRQQGVSSQRIIGLMAWWCGLAPRRTELSSQEFLQIFDLSRLPRQSVTFTPEDHQWLLQH